MAYSGTYKVKNRSKYRGNSDNIVYRSMWERHVMKWCDEQSSVISWSSEEIVIPYYYDVDKRYHRYFVDFLIQYADKTVLVEVKPKKETVVPVKKGKVSRQYVSESLTYVKNMNKWDAAESYAADRKWEFQIWTEETLHELGIMKKGLKPLKPLKKLINKKKKPGK
jgi:hypothetical protein